MGAMLKVCLLVLTLEQLGRTQTRILELEQLRSEHQRSMSPERNGKVEEMMRRLKDDKILERLNYGYNGLSARLGGLVTGGGFAFGPQYLRNDIRDGFIAIGAGAQISVRNYQKADAHFGLPKLLNGKAAFDLRTVYRNYPGINYYGPGPDSAKLRTNYRLEDRSSDATFAVAPARHVRIGGGAGFLGVNIGRGTDSRFSSTDRVFSNTQVPGLDRQTDFARYGIFGEYDWRDNPFGPRRGGSYVVQYVRFNDRGIRLHNFNLLEVDLQQYVPLANRSRVFAFRAYTRLTGTEGGQTVPFYLQPVVGGSDDLRGFRPFRFSGNNSVVLNGEYRWAIFSGCDGALFVDGGKVFQRRGHLNFNDIEGSAGFGLRFNARNRTFMRLDVGFSHEGFQVWFKFNDIFAQRPLGTADSQPVL